MMVDIDQWLSTQNQHTAELMARTEQLKATMSETRCSGSSSDQSVTATVGPTGTLLDLRLSPNASDLSLGLLTSRIMEAYRAACLAASAHTFSAMEQAVGSDSSVLEFLRTTMPQQAEVTDADLEAESWRG
jgi:hypothetical protein